MTKQTKKSKVTKAEETLKQSDFQLSLSRNGHSFGVEITDNCVSIASSSLSNIKNYDDLVNYYTLFGQVMDNIDEFMEETCVSENNLLPCFCECSE